MSADSFYFTTDATGDRDSGDHDMMVAPYTTNDAAAPRGQPTPLNDLILWKPGWPDPGDQEPEQSYDMVIG